MLEDDPPPQKRKKKADSGVGVHLLLPLHTTPVLTVLHTQAKTKVRHALGVAAVITLADRS